MTAPSTSVTAPADQALTQLPTAEEQRESKTAMAIGTLPQSVRDALILKRQQNLVSAEIAGTNWGKGLDRETRFRISEWAASADIDPATELHVLGGSFYKNANYYLRKLSEMIAAGLVEYAIADHVEVDARLEKRALRTDSPDLARDARAEADRRESVRIEYQIPDAAVSSVVWRVKLFGIDSEFTAAKWCGGGTRKSDPVGDQFPVETSETRAARRCMRLIASQNPRFKRFVEPNDDDTIDAQIGGDLRAGLQRAKEAQRENEPTRRIAGPAEVITVDRGEPATTAKAPEEALPPIDPTNVDGLGIPMREGDRIAETPASAPKAAAPLEEGPQNDLDLLTPAERADHEQRKRDGRK